MTEKLKPCPFCGSIPTTAINYRRAGGRELELEFGVICPSCKTGKYIVKEVGNKTFEEYKQFMKDAIIKWNTRYENK